MPKSWLVRLTVSCLVLAALLWLVPLTELWGAMRAVPLAVWIVTVAVFLLGHAAAALKWSLLMPGHAGLPTRVWLAAHFAGLVANLALPGLASGDVVRAGWVINRAGRSEDVAFAGVVDRVIDCAALLTLAVVGLLIAGGEGGRAGRAIVLTSTALVAAAVLVLVALRHWHRRGTSGLVGRIVAAARMLAGEPWRPAVALLMSLGIQLVFLLLNMRLGLSAGVSVGPTAWLVAWPLAKLVALIPLGLAGLGVREAALVAFLTPFGAAPGPVVAAGLLWEGVLFAGGLVGWLMTMVWPKEKR